ncbi:MAG: hypothetical protein RLN81_12655 [Balneolaceae bacterium]
MRSLKELHSEEFTTGGTKTVKFDIKNTPIQRLGLVGIGSVNFGSSTITVVEVKQGGKGVTLHSATPLSLYLAKNDGDYGAVADDGGNEYLDIDLGMYFTTSTFYLEVTLKVNVSNTPSTGTGVFCFPVIGDLEEAHKFRVLEITDKQSTTENCVEMFIEDGGDQMLDSPWTIEVKTPAYSDIIDSRAIVHNSYVYAEREGSIPPENITIHKFYESDYDRPTVVTLDNKTGFTVYAIVLEKKIQEVADSVFEIERLNELNDSALDTGSNETYEADLLSDL